MVTIHPPYSSHTKITRYRNFLQDSPHIASYTRTLVIIEAEVCQWPVAPYTRAGAGFKAVSPSAWRMDTYISKNWTLDDPDLPIILSCFRGLKRFMWKHGDNAVSDWELMSEGMKEAFRKTLELETLMTVDLVGIRSFPLSTFLFPSSLRALCLDNVLCSDDPDDRSRARRSGKQARLEALSLRYPNTDEELADVMASWLTDSRCPINSRCLKTLELPACWLGRENPMWGVIAKETIERLSICYRAVEDSASLLTSTPVRSDAYSVLACLALDHWGEYVGLDEFPSLRYLETHFKRVEYSPGSAFNTLIDLCEESLNTSNIAHFTLTVAYCQGREISQSGNDPWDRLDDILSSSDTITRVELRFIPEGGEPILTPVPDIQLPLLGARTGVTVRVVDERYGSA
ncbi:hypothetical protein AX16_010437 [Volvariella volvacea WC 439]|nr:hypothetical protein AX16_010437 [Volvariella volvacea WC 439]